MSNPSSNHPADGNCACLKTRPVQPGHPGGDRTQGWSLNPGRYVGVADHPAGDFVFAKRLEALNEELEVLNVEAWELETRMAEIARVNDHSPLLFNKGETNMAKNDIYQIKVTLNHSKPPIWRRIQVRGDTRLDKLHDILQTVMGWWNAHLHQFIVGGTYYGEPHPDYGFDMRDERKVKLNQIATGEKFKFIYEYDFGDSWEHVLLVEKILSPEEGGRYPRCIKGKRACPPEDVGGVWGYAYFLEAIKDPNHPEHEDMLEWVGGDLDPEEFDLAAVNEALQHLR